MSSFSHASMYNFITVRAVHATTADQLTDCTLQDFLYLAAASQHLEQLAVPHSTSSVTQAVHFQLPTYSLAQRKSHHHLKRKLTKVCCMHFACCNKYFAVIQPYKLM